MKNVNSIDWTNKRPDLTELSNPFDTNSYIETRAKFKVKKYFILAKRSENIYKTIAISTLILSALVPIIINTSFIPDEKLKALLASLASFLVVALFSVESVYNFREQWKSYKNAEDAITEELNLYRVSAEPYSPENEKASKEKLLVMRVEGIILKERKDTIEKLTSNVKQLGQVSGNFENDKV
jgi:hypothetical protein